MESLVDVGHCPHYRSPTAWTLARVNADSAELWLSPGNSAKEKSATAKSFWHVHCTDHQKQLQLTGNESAKHGFFYSATTLAFSFTSTVVGRVLLEWNSTALGHHHSTTAEFVCYIIYHFSWSILFIEDLLKYLLFCQGKKTCPWKYLMKSLCTKEVFTFRMLWYRMSKETAKDKRSYLS